jgi:hypothetical protein
MKKLMLATILCFLTIGTMIAQNATPATPDTKVEQRGKREKKDKMDKKEEGKEEDSKMEKRGNRAMPTAQEMADKETERQTKMLNLNTDQIAKVKVFNLKYCQQRADALNNPNRQGLGKTMQAIREAQDTELKTILTPDQQAILTQKRGRMEQKGNRKSDDKDDDDDKGAKESKDNKGNKEWKKGKKEDNKN